MTPRRACAPLLALSLFLPQALAQNVAANTKQGLVFAGLRSIAAQGQINALNTDPAGDIYLLFDQKDGVRVLKIANDGGMILAQVHIGARGDSGAAMAIDPQGSLYVAGTSSSGSLSATAGAAIPALTASTTNSFVAKFDSSLAPIFLTFTGGSRIAASAIAASADAVFVSGITYGSDLPVTPDAIQQTPAFGSSQNGFVEKFSTDGDTLEYATYITGALGDTTPTAIAVDAGDDAWLVGSTSASGFPTISAIIPQVLSNPSGFLLRLTPAGDGIVFSTFVPGPGLTSIALDSTGQTLLISGVVALGQFPVDTVSSVLVPTSYQVLLRMPLDGSSVFGGTVIAPGQQSVVTASPGGAAWIAGAFTPGSASLLPQPALANIGNAYAVRLTQQGSVDQTIRFGGLANGHQAFASIPIILNGLTVDTFGDLIAGGAAQPTASADLLSSQTYDLPLRGPPSPALPSILKDAELAPGQCRGSLCEGSAGYLAKVDIASTTPALTFSLDDLPIVTLRNLASTATEGLQLTSSSGTLMSTCTATLAPGGECDALLSGGSPGTLTASASNAAAEAVSYPSYPATPPTGTLTFFPKELDFGVQTSSTSPSVATIIVSNLGSDPQTFASGIPLAPQSTTPFSESSSDCALAPSGIEKLLAGGATCHINVAFQASSSSANDSFVSGEWSIGTRQVLLTGYSQAASLSLSSAEIDFGTQFQGGIALPRFLFLSNSSSASIPHASVSLPTASPFTVTDACPATLEARSICRIRLDYLSPAAPSSDSITLTLDQGLAVLLTGTTMPPPSVGGQSVNPDLTVSPLSATFGDAVVVTGISAVTQTIGITNSGQSDFPLAIALTGDFTDVTSCGAILAAGATCAVAIQFTPSTPGARQGLLSVTAGADTSPVIVPLSGFASPILAGNNGTLAFGGVPVGQPLVQFYKVTQPFNSLTLSTSGPYRVTLIEDAGFGHGDPPSSSFVTAGSGTCHNCWIAVRFQPVTPGAQSGTLNFSSAAQGLPYTLALIGSGIADSGLIFTPSIQDFGSTPVNSTTGSVQFTLTNGSASGPPISLSSPTTTGDFHLISASQTGQPCASSLSSGDSCSVAVSFAPTTAGARSGALTFVTSAGTISAPLAGSGAPDPGIALNPLALIFSNTGGPSSTSQAVSVTNTGPVSVQIAAPSTSSPSFNASTACNTLAPAATCTIQVTFAPGVAPATGILTIPVLSPGSDGMLHTIPYSIVLSGTYTSSAAGLEVTPTTIDFGPTATLTQGPTRVVTVTNLTPKSLTLSSNLPHNFVLAGQPCTALQPASSCSFQLQSIPLTNGDLAGTIALRAVPSDGSPTLDNLAYAESFGVGTGALTLTGGSLANGHFSFGQVSAGQSLSQTFTLANQGSPTAPPIAIRRNTSAPPFASSTSCQAPLSVGQSCTITVTYTPTSQTGAGTPDQGSLTIESDTQSSPDVITLTAQPGQSSASSLPTPLVAFALSTNSLTFPQTTVGDTSPAQTLVLTNTGTTPLVISSAISSPDFAVQNACAALAVGASCSISISAHPQTSGTHLAALQISSNATTSLEFVSLITVGAPSALTITPASLDFGPVQVGASAVLPVQVSNEGSTPITFRAIVASASYTAAGTCPAPGSNLAPQASCVVQVTFSPTSMGVLPGSLAFDTSASTSPLRVALTGTGTAAQLLASPSSLAFGAIVIGSSSNLSLKLTNNGSAPLSLLSVTPSGDYAVTIPCPQPSLAPGTSCTLQITFSPSALGTRNGSLIIASSDPTSPLTLPLTGSGISNGNFNLTVNGAASASLTITSGQLATYALLATPTGTFSGSLALTCTPTQPVQYASCSLLPSLLDLSSGPASAAASINTLASAATVASTPSQRPRIFLALLLPLLLFSLSRRKRPRTRLALTLAFTAVFCALTLDACSSNGSSNLRYTPAGIYQFQINAASTSGAQLTQTVTLYLTVNPR